VLAEPAAHQFADAARLDLRVAVYTPDGVDSAAAAGRPVRLHVKVDTGMHRVGARPGDAVALARRIAGDRRLVLDGVMTHLAVADEPGDTFTDRQLDAFDAALDDLRAAGVDPPLVHAANSAGALAHPRARRSFVRAGIATYGIAPGPELADRCGELRPALTLTARVSFVKRVEAGERISYGLRHTFDRDTTVATVPLGYADGVPRRLSSTGGSVLVGGRSRPITGVVTMDQLMVDCGDDDVARGDEVVLIGAQGDERVTADEWAERLGTIAYEVTCGIGARVPRVHVPGGGDEGR